METFSPLLVFCGHPCILHTRAQQCRTLMFSLLLAWIRCWTNIRCQSLETPRRSSDFVMLLSTSTCVHNLIDPILIPEWSLWLMLMAHQITLRWRHNEHDDVSNHQGLDCLLNRLFRLRSKKTSTLRVTGLCEGNSPLTGEFPAQMASNAENVSMWWRLYASRRRDACMSLVN